MCPPAFVPSGTDPNGAPRRRRPFHDSDLNQMGPADSCWIPASHQDAPARLPTPQCRRVSQGILVGHGQLFRIGDTLYCSRRHPAGGTDRPRPADDNRRRNTARAVLHRDDRFSPDDVKRRTNRWSSLLAMPCPDEPGQPKKSLQYIATDMQLNALFEVSHGGKVDGPHSL